MRGQIGGLAQAQRNAQDGISLVQTAEGALTEVHSMLQRVRDLKVQFNNGTNSSDDKDAIAAEVSQIALEIGDIVTDTKFNGTAVFGSGTFAFQVGANDGETISTTAANFSRRRRQRRHRRPRRRSLAMSTATLAAQGLCNVGGGGACRPSR